MNITSSRGYYFLVGITNDVPLSDLRLDGIDVLRTVRWASDDPTRASSTAVETACLRQIIFVVFVTLHLWV